MGMDLPSTRRRVIMPPHSKSTHLAIFARLAPPARLRTQGSLLHQVVNARLVRCFDGGMPRWGRRPEEHWQGHAFCWTQVTQPGGFPAQITDFALILDRARSD